MGMTKTQRIVLLLIIDTIFFLIELIVGYAVHSLALVADAFHMLNDVLSLCVGLWAVKVANEKTSSKSYTYGWQRAETLGALVNGVFLVALCLSIFLEAIQRLVEVQVVKNPKLVLIVGCFGLFSNIVGLLLFHDHSHGHGGHGVEEATDVEQGYVEDADTAAVLDPNGNVAGVMPQNAIEACETDTSVSTVRPIPNREANGSSGAARKSHGRGRRSSASARAQRDPDSIQIHPASLRQDIIDAGRFSESESSGADDVRESSEVTERSGLLQNSKTTSTYDQKPMKATNGARADLHVEHNHAKPKTDKKGHGHSHDLNMRGVFLHVVGDALGNIGVIASALVIWKTDYSWRYYVDPGISLFITMIILWSAIPLCKAASRILLQAVPAGLSVDHIIEDVESLPGVLSCHHLHVWQLSDTKLVASLHIQVSHDIKGEGSDRYMTLARDIRKCLHAYGIHSSTIQPEFYPDSDDEGSPAPRNAPGSPPRNGSGSETSACLLQCGNECAAARQCCT
ncbi:Zinc resistance conferring protein [Ophidiomyces ophidiicola]|uniref:Zinc resistance conferring protein n=1 Tax=Ophidiomyces ophidiicola TaxID=1387563 RepID=UPI0020C3C246|nr:Zinc resistance conferring protein [Ophidiomyces ophidiicola]KAI1913164.1 Zinc resistance conferring protein [Ophidiomyces ophidiicola]KAI1920723.1 Zinc resistance conferring protein [Ophidiomyces ophidiicola]KAI1928576.1 Zinc resistance conferring protein [Ophidiomyces ophidiicola]KAI1946137.1 Zinc resistance conferring protein [Ophidiomyces ophidiicola]KAI1961232.1 Zinc resistance conferring protein [Ophidiomyces ophidiicola]